MVVRVVRVGSAPKSRTVVTPVVTSRKSNGTLSGGRRRPASSRADSPRSSTKRRASASSRAARAGHRHDSHRGSGARPASARSAWALAALDDRAGRSRPARAPHSVTRRRALEAVVAQLPAEVLLRLGLGLHEKDSTGYGDDASQVARAAPDVLCGGKIRGLGVEPIPRRHAVACAVHVVRCAAGVVSVWSGKHRCDRRGGGGASRAQTAVCIHRFSGFWADDLVLDRGTRLRECAGGCLLSALADRAFHGPIPPDACAPIVRRATR